MERMAEINNANLEAEGRWARSYLYGQEASQETPNPTGPEDDGEEMANTTVLGDVTHPTPIVVQPPQQSPVGMLLLTAAIAAGIPGAAMLGYVLANKPINPAVSPQGPQQYEQIEIGLGRIEDFEKVQP